MYQRFANIYDLFMSETPYASWAAYIDDTLRHLLPPPQAHTRPIVVDLACGTGGVTIPLAAAGYDMIGVDISHDMLSEAQNKAARGGFPILFLAQDMRKLDLYGTADAMLCVCDGLNYLPDVAALARVFRRVARFLNPGGVFFFDMNTTYKYKHILRDKRFTDVVDGASYFWQNDYNETTRINEYRMHFFVENGDGSTTRFTETHYQRAYPRKTVETLLHRARLTVCRVNDAYTYAPPKPTSERLTFVAVADRG